MPVVDALLRGVDKGVLEGVRGVKTGVDRLRGWVQTIRRELEVRSVGPSPGPFLPRPTL